MNEFKHSLNDSIVDQLLIEITKKGRPQSPIPDDKGQDFTSAEVPHEIQSLLPLNNNTRAISPHQLITFPPEIPTQYHTYLKSPTIEPKNQTITVTEPVFPINFKSNSQERNIFSQSADGYSQIKNLKYLPTINDSRWLNGPISAAMEIAPDRPFTPIVMTESIIKPTPWISLPRENENRPESPLIAALKIAPERNFSPLPTFVYASELEPTPFKNDLKDIKKPMHFIDKSVLPQSLDLKPSEIKSSTRPIGDNPVKYMHGYNNKISNISSKNNQPSPKPIPTSSSQSAKITSFSFKPLSSLSEKSIISGPYKPVESKSNYNETIITQVPNFEKQCKTRNEDIPTNSDQNVSFNHLQTKQDLTKPQQSSNLDNKSTINRPLGPGIKNKVSTFTSNTSIVDTPFLKQPSGGNNNIVENLSNKFRSVDSGSYIKSNHSSAVKLSKAVPFFSSAYFPSTLNFTQMYKPDS
jgi:hypothetical protein